MNEPLPARQGFSGKSPRRVLRRRLLVGGLLLTTVDVFVLSHERLLTWLAYRFRAQDDRAPSDAIVVLLGGAADRAAMAAALYRRGLAPVILLGRSREDGPDRTGSCRRVLIQNGVPEAAIRSLPGAAVESTHDEALRVRDFVRDHPVRALTVVTTAFHTARSRWTFARVMSGTGVAVRMVASENPALTERNWYESSFGVKIYALEALKTIYYRLAY